MRIKTLFISGDCLADDVYPRSAGLGAGHLVLLEAGQQVLPHPDGLVGEALQEQPPLGQEQGLVGLLVLQLCGELQ